MTTHVNNLIAKAGQATYALKLVKSHGLPMRSMDIVTQSTLFSPLTYASPAWIGYANKEDLSRLQAPINRAHRWGLCSASLFQALCDKADQTLFQKVTSFTVHIYTLCYPSSEIQHTIFAHVVTPTLFQIHPTPFREISCSECFIKHAT